jgi:MoxR-like ATPase
VEGLRRSLPELFFVIATQNPVEFRGTYPLPEAQMDRFAIELSLGYVSLEHEMAVLSAQQKAHTIDEVAPVVNLQEITAVRHAAANVRVSDEIKRYMVELVQATRHQPGVVLGASPRASIALMKVAQALAVFDGLSFVTPELVQELAVPVIAHRLAVDPQARFAGTSPRQVVGQIVKKIPVPS